MARTFTLAEIRTRVLERADMQNSAFVGESEVNGYISQSYTRLYNYLVRTGHAYFESEQSITADGTADYDLPSDYLGTVGVDYRYDGTHWRSLKRIQPQERNRYQADGTNEAVAYRIVGSEIILYPTPASGQTYRHLYVPAAAKLTSDAQTVDGVSGFEELLVIDAAIKCRIKEESSVEELVRERALMMQELEDAAEMREMTQAHRVVDVTSGHETYLDPASWRLRVGGDW